MRILIKFTLFFLYVALFFVVPLGLLWGANGLGIGLILAIGFLFVTRYDGTQKILKKIQATSLSVSEAPLVYHIVDDYCRRLGIARPTIWVIDSPAPNFALFGFSRRFSHLALTRGAMTHLRRNELSALIGWELTYLWHKDLVTESWLSLFLSALNPSISPTKQSHSRLYPFWLFAKQLLIYPLTIFPTSILSSPKDLTTIDEKSIRLTGNPRELAEGLRIVDAFKEREPLFTPYSTRHLFMVPPPIDDPLVRAFFGPESLTERIAQVESFTHVVVPS